MIEPGYLRLDEVPGPGLREFRVARPWLAVAVMTTILGVCAWGAGLGFRAGLLAGAGFWLLAWIVFWLVLFWLLLLRLLRKALSPDAWLVRATPAGLYVKWRSFQNLAWPGDTRQVLFLPYAAIAEARQHRRRWWTPAERDGGSRAQGGCFLELQLRGVDTSGLANHLADDRAGRPDGKPITQWRWRHHPVTLEPGDLLRIEWRATPGVPAMLDLLRSHGVAVTGAQRSTADLSRGADPAELAELARQGDLMAIVRVLREQREMSLEEARAQAREMIDGAGPGKG